MKILKISGIVLLVIIGVILVLGFVSPVDFKVERSVIIPVNEKKVVYDNLVNRTEFLKWNPWMAKYPNQKITFKGEEGKVGSSYKWEGNEDAGKGEMRLTRFVPFERVEMDLHFIEPWETVNKTTFIITPESAGYKVSWIMTGSSPFPFNIMNLFMNCMIGPDFESGLKNLKQKSLADSTVSEKKSEIPAL